MTTFKVINFFIQRYKLSISFVLYKYILKRFCFMLCYKSYIFAVNTNNNMKNPYWMLVGFILFLLGILSVIFSLVGLKIDILSAVYGKGVWTLLFQITLIIGGIIIIYMSKLAQEDDGE